MWEETTQEPEFQGARMLGVHLGGWLPLSALPSAEYIEPLQGPRKLYLISISA